MDNNPDPIVESFNKYFYVVRANTAELRELVYRIRYQIYCEEFNYEPHNPSQVEQDPYDSHSQHSLLIHKDTEKPVGCFRLVLPGKDVATAPLPFEQFCSRPRRSEDTRPVTLPYGRIGELTESDRVSGIPVLKDFDLSSLPPGSFGEASRLAVLSAFRRRQNDERNTVSLTGNDKAEGARYNFPIIPVGLALVCLSMFLRSTLQYMFALMEPSLARFFRSHGITFLQVGSIVNFHGQRGPFVLRREDVLSNLKPNLHPFYQFIDQQLFGESGYKPPLAEGGDVVRPQ